MERSVNEVNRMLGDPGIHSTALSLSSNRKGGTRSKVTVEKYCSFKPILKLDYSLGWRFLL